ncbi:MAG: hypothetical protein IEMM0008_0772 [bacterium]|nr:MAG: hypothetical protein IEMM0008_0772 [bacterium]
MQSVTCTFSALKHGISEQEILNVLMDNNAFRELIKSDDLPTYKLIGEISKGDKAEIIYKQLSQDSISVFHAIRVL